MAVYKYQSGVIDEMQVLTNESGGERAYLHAAANASPEQLAQMQTAISSMGWKSVPVLQEGRSVLEVRGFKKRDRLVRVLQANGWAHETPAIQAQQGDKRTTGDKVRNWTLRLSGLTYIFGDWMFMTYARKQQLHERTSDPSKGFSNKMNIAAGIGYAMGSLALLFYGSRDQSQNTIQTASRKIHGYLRGDAVDIPQDSAMHDIVRKEKRGFFGNINHTLAKYPSEVMNSIYVGVGAILSGMAIFRAIHASRTGNRVELKEELLDVGLGIITTASALTGLAVKERKPEEGQKKRKGFGRIIDWIQEKPLRATGIGYIIATGCHAVATFLKYQRHDSVITETAHYRGAFAGANIVAEGLLAVSSKGHGTGVKPDNSIDTTVIAATADLIHRQPAEKREAMVCQLAGYMASSDVIGGKADVIAAQLREQLDGLQKNPWVRAVMPVTRSAANDQLTSANDVGAVSERPGIKVAGAEHVAMLAPTQAQAGLTAS